jgi:hypothetical protein
MDDNVRYSFGSCSKFGASLASRGDSARGLPHDQRAVAGLDADF